MGKLHTLRRAILRSPRGESKEWEYAGRKNGRWIPWEAAMFRVGRWMPMDNWTGHGSYARFCKSVLRDMGRVGNADSAEVPPR